VARRTVHSAMTITIHYRTGWRQPSIHKSADGGKSWTQQLFSPTRTSPIGPHFRVVTLAVQSLPLPAILFVLTDGDGSWDNPSSECDPSMRSGRNYSIDPSIPGAYVLFGGRLTRFRPGAVLKAKALTIVTDIDGTLYGCPDGLNRLNELWCRELALAGTFLVYNTGRSVESVVALIHNNYQTMPVPVATVTRVGGFCHWFRPNPCLPTSEWLPFAVGNDTDASAEPLPYDLDDSWHATLSRVDGWDHRRYRGVLDDLIANDRGHWLEDGKDCDAKGIKCFQIAVGVRVEHLHEILYNLKTVLVDEPVKYIVSGEGSHRYLDLAIEAAGKFGGTRHVVSQLPGESGRLCNVVFCGDSGNDSDALMGDVKGIVVANAQPDLLHALQGIIDNLADSTSLPSGVKVSNVTKVGKEHAVLMTKASFADGILEGLAMHGFL
jgi:hydroxymethylpyrimidine pyrophosphatase-like HAD family hydrolase